VDIGFEKNAFLHYWDIVPKQLRQQRRIVERGQRRRDKPRITQRDIPRLYPPGTRSSSSRSPKGPSAPKAPASPPTSPARPLPRPAPQLGPERHLAQDREPGGTPAAQEDPARTQHPRGHGRHHPHRRRGPAEALFRPRPRLLLEEWHEIQERIDAQALATCVFREPDLVERTVRDFLTEDVERIVIDSPTEFDRVRQMIGASRNARWPRSSSTPNPQPIFDRFSITRQLEGAFSRQVHLKSGGYIVIDETEALVAIDVNTGRHKSSGKDQESVIYKVNLEAADEICRQLRLRNMGGLIVLDFIDMKSRRDQQSVYQRMKEGLRRDRAKTHVLPISQLGLMEMTRQRHTESVRASVYDDCPTAKAAARSRARSP
jgi:ribonuclease G